MAMINAQISVVGMILPLSGALAPVPLLPIMEGRGMDAGNEGRRQPGELPGVSWGCQGLKNGREQKKGL